MGFSLGLYVFVSFSLMSAETSKRIKSREYMVTALDRNTGQFKCMGGIISIRSVITSCSCIGTFSRQTFELNKLDEFELVTVAGNRHRLNKAFVHHLCAPTRWNYTANNLGGWMIQGSFDMRTVIILQPALPFNVTIFHSLEVICYGHTYRKNGPTPTALERTPNHMCLSLYCAVYNIKTDQCQKMKEEFYNGKEVCSMIQMDNVTYNGSPVICTAEQSSGNIVFYGVVGFTSKVAIIWTRVDSEENRHFLDEIRRSEEETDSASPLQPCLVILLTNLFLFLK